MKRMTRREVETWLDLARRPLRSLLAGQECTVLAEIHGEVEIERWAVEDRQTGEFMRVDGLLSGLLGCLGRLFPAADLAPAECLAATLAAGVAPTEREVRRALACLTALVKPLMRLPEATVREAARAECLLIAMEHPL